MKRWIGVLMGAAILAAGMPATALAEQGRIQKRKANQQERIAKGVEDGSLTAKETAKIERKEAQLNREIAKDRVDGGGLTAKERVKIEHKQDKLSRKIYKQKHDAQTQK
jgi:hypothetical protein